MKTYQVWTEGYRAVGISKRATYHGAFKGDTFREAVAAFKSSLKPTQKDLVDIDRMTYWGCRFRMTGLEKAREARAAMRERGEKVVRLNDIKQRFADKDKGGRDVRLYDYIEGQNYPVLGAVLKDGTWALRSWRDDGLRLATPNSSDNLVRKKKHLPKDILCEVWDEPSPGNPKRYSDGEARFYVGGSDSYATTGEVSPWKHYKIIKNPERPWFGGECPIPEGCRFRVRVGREWKDGMNTPAFGWVWDEDSHYPITAYQILGEIDDKTRV